MCRLAAVGQVSNLPDKIGQVGNLPHGQRPLENCHRRSILSGPPVTASEPPASKAAHQTRASPPRRATSLPFSTSQPRRKFSGVSLCPLAEKTIRPSAENTPKRTAFSCPS